MVMDVKWFGMLTVAAIVTLAAMAASAMAAAPTAANIQKHIPHRGIIACVGDVPASLQEALAADGYVVHAIAPTDDKAAALRQTITDATATRRAVPCIYSS